MTLLLWYSINLYGGILYGWQWTKNFTWITFFNHLNTVTMLTPTCNKFWCITNHPKLSDLRKLYTVYFSHFCGSAGQFCCCQVSSLMSLHTDGGGSEEPHSKGLAISAGCLLKLLSAPHGLLSSSLWQSSFPRRCSLRSIHRAKEEAARILRA